MRNLDVIKDKRMYSNWLKIEPVDKGWSDDKKFYIEDGKGQKMLLRVTDISQYEAKRHEYVSMNMISMLGITMSNPIDFGICAKGQSVYSLLTWVDGEDAEIVLPKYSENKQYEFGIEAGKILNRIHSVPAPVNQEDWAQFFKRKTQKIIRKYRNCLIKLDNDLDIIQFIEENISYLDNRPQAFQHGDFHVGNLIILQGSEVGVIDFNRTGFGDPWEEFNRCVFSWKVSIPFTVGQIHGYFNNNVPDKFFSLMKLYIAVNTISSIPWALPFGDVEVRFMLNNAKEVFEFYNDFKTDIPVWYKDPL